MVDVLTKIERIQRRTNLDKEIIARDMLQSRMLMAMFSTATERELALKGGMAMHAAFGSHRYTKDIDLQTGPETPMARIKSIVEGAMKSATSSGILENIKISAPKQTDTVQRWKLNGTISGGQSTVNLTVEVSRRGMPTPNAVKTIAYAPFDDDLKAVSVDVNVYNIEAIAASKVDCLLNPNRMAPRDIFDLNYLIVTMRVDPPIEFLRRLGKNALAEGIKEVWSKIEAMDWDLARTDLKPYIAGDSKDEFTEDVWFRMRYETAEVVENWMRKAIAEEERENPTPRL